VDVNEIIIRPTRQEFWSGAIAWESIDSLLNTAQRLNWNKGWWIEPYPTQHRQAAADSRFGLRWRSGIPLLNELAAERGVGELEHEYEESPCNGPSVNQPIFVKTAIKKENRIISVSNVVVSSSMIMNPTPSDSQSVKSECLKMYVNAIRFPTSVEC